MRKIFACLVAAGLIFMANRLPLRAQADPQQDVQSILGVDPTPVREEIMSQDKLLEFIEHLKKGTPLQLKLDKGKVVKGLFSSYDDYYESVWLVPQGEKGVFTEKSYKIAGIRSAALWIKETSSTNGFSTLQQIPDDEYYLLKKNGMKQR